MSLKVFNLQCEAGHLFEGWFGSHDDYDDQHARGLISCPMCESKTIQKMPSAPRINMGRAQEVVPASAPVASPGSALSGRSQDVAQVQAAIMQQMRALVSAAENVGARFADEARRIHEGEAVERSIRGVATAEERQALAEDGIAVIALPEFLDTDRLQ
jgi:hypothetical protein